MGVCRLKNKYLFKKNTCILEQCFIMAFNSLAFRLTTKTIEITDEYIITGIANPTR